MTFNEFCKTLNLSPETYEREKLSVLRKWVRENLSQDIDYQGDEKHQWQQYIELVRFYFDTFLPNKSENLKELIPAFENASTLYFAADGGLDQVIISLQPTAEDINHQNAHGMTALHIATLNGHLQTVKCLLELGANPQLKNQQGMTALQTSLMLPFSYGQDLKDKRRQLFKMLFPQTDNALSLIDSSGNSLLHMSINNGFNGIADQLIKSQPSLINAVNHQGLYPIHTAILNGNLKAALRLIPLNGVVEQLDENQRNALHYVALTNRYQLIDDIAKTNQNINQQDDQGKTALLLAVEFNHPDVARKLIALRAEVNQADIYQMTALHWAVKNDSIELVKLLFEHARPELKDENGMTAQDYIEQNFPDYKEICGIFNISP